MTRKTNAPDLDLPCLSTACLRQSERGFKRASDAVSGVGGKHRKGGSNTANPQKKCSVKGVNKPPAAPWHGVRESPWAEVCGAKKPRDRDLSDSSQCIIELFDLSVRLRHVYVGVRQLLEKTFPRLVLEVMQKQNFPEDSGDLAQKLAETKKMIENLENWSNGEGRQ